MVVLSHGHADHITGLIQVLRRYDVKYIVKRRTDYASPGYLEWEQAVVDRGASLTQV